MNQFNLRVYGILMNEKNQVLVSDELIRGKRYTKFPGGGLEFGEGTRECLQREFMEELGLKVEVLEHIYTTDFFQESAFRPGDQIISIYYFVKPLEPIAVRLSDIEFDFDENQLLRYKENGEVETFRFIDWEQFSDACLSLPIDKIVARILKKNAPGKVPI